MLGLARKGAAISNSLWIVVATLISWSFLADLGAIVASLNYPTAPIIALLILPVLLIYFVFQAIFLRIRFTRQYMAVYRYAVELTGDPLAMLVSTATLNILAAVSAKTPTSLQKQMNALEQLLQQPGPRAPWADRPVPAITTFKSGVYQLTIPLVQSPPPEPISGVPYPNTGLNFSSPEAFFTASDKSPSQGTIYTE